MNSQEEEHSLVIPRSLRCPPMAPVGKRYRVARKIPRSVDQKAGALPTVTSLNQVVRPRTSLDPKVPTRKMDPSRLGLRATEVAWV